MTNADQAGKESLKETTRHNWLNWVAAGLIICGETFSFSITDGYYENSILVECIEWIDYSALLFGGLASLAILFYWLLNANETSKGWKRALRILCQLEGVRLLLYGAGIDVGLGSACEQFI